MVHTFKFGGQRIAYDSVSGLTLPLSELAYKMLDYIELPMAKECSSALRYDLAKFDSAAIGETYDMLYALYRDGKLFAEGELDEASDVGGAAVALGDVICGRSDPHILDRVKVLADEGKDVVLRIVDAPEGIAAFTDEEIATVAKELEKIAKEQSKRARGAIDGVKFKAFVPLEPAEHTDEACAHCWANKLCTLSAPRRSMCELECKRAECVMMCDAASK